MNTPNTSWNDDAIQFPRLLCEIQACVDVSMKNWMDLQESMGLSEGEILDLFERATAKWDSIKETIEAGKVSKVIEN